MKTNTFIWICILLSFTQMAQAQNYTRTITVEFDAPPAATSVQKTKLKYNKEFAYSLTLDDGQADIWHVAYKLLKGDQVTHSFYDFGVNYGGGTNDIIPGGYNSTDGCGNLVQFKLGVSLNTRTVDLTGAFLNWDQLQEIYDHGWDIYNHSYNHETDPAHPINTALNSPISMDQAIEGNSDSIQAHIGFYPRHFVIPSNSETYLCDFGLTNTCTDQNTNGMVAVYNQNFNWLGPAIPVNNPIDLDFINIYRNTVPFYQNSGWNEISAQINNAASQSNDYNKIWLNEYTHSIRVNDGNHVPGLSNLGYTYFKQLMDLLRNQYGENGTDEVWVAGLQSVYEYLYVRDHANITTTTSGNTMTITATFSNPQPDQENFDLSILAKDLNANIINISVDGGEMTYNSTSGLINFNFLGGEQNQNDITLNCPSNINVTTTSNVATVSWADATAYTTCNTTNVSVYQNEGPTAGSDFYIGNYNITYQATDDCNNSATCTFAVNVTQESTGGSCTAINGFTKLGEYNNHGYYISNDPNNWAAAKNTSEINGGYLASMNSVEENGFIKNKIAPLNGMVFIGFNDATSEGSPQWANGQPVTLDLSYANSTENDYAVMNYWAGTWQMEQAGPWRKYVMEKSCGGSSNTGNINIQCPSAIDIETSAGSETVQWQSATASTTCSAGSNVQISQSQGMPSGSNFQVGTHTITYQATDDCNNLESCSFSINVTQENTGGSCTTINGFTKLGEYNNHGYYISNDPNNWAAAKNTSEINGGYLASMNSAEENGFIKNKIAPLNEMVFIGFNDATSEGNPEWINGEPVTLDLSYANSANNDYAVMNYWAGTWQMEQAGPWRKYVMEMSCSGSNTGNINIQCPTAIEIETTSDTEVAQWQSATASTTCSMGSSVQIEQIGGLPSGSNFPIGTHTITYQAADLCENIATCQFVITVSSEPNGGGCNPIDGFSKIGEFEHHGYYLSDDNFKWLDAKNHAENNNGYMTSISTQAENEFLKGNIGTNLVFIGFHDSETEGTGQWANGEGTGLDLSYGNTEDNDFAVMNFWAGTWEMINGRISKPYILEKTCSNSTNGSLSIDCSTDITLEITTNSTLAYWDDPVASTTCPNGSDVSLVLISNKPAGSEFELGNYIIMYEATDACGNTQFCSFKLNIVSVGSGESCAAINGFSKIGEFENHGYYLSDETLNWKEANTYTQSLGGYLVAINSQVENDFIKSNIENNLVFIGFTDENEEGAVSWSNGDPVTIDLSYGNTDDRDYAIMNFWAGTWEMHNVLVSKKYVMEMNCGNQQQAKISFQNHLPKGIQLQAVFPNPANDLVFAKVIANTNEEISFSIVNLQGKIMATQKTFFAIGRSQLEFNISSLPTGTYFLRANGRNTVQVLHFVKTQ